MRGQKGATPPAGQRVPLFFGYSHLPYYRRRRRRLCSEPPRHISLHGQGRSVCRFVGSVGNMVTGTTPSTPP